MSTSRFDCDDETDDSEGYKDRGVKFLEFLLGMGYTRTSGGRWDESRNNVKSYNSHGGLRCVLLYDIPVLLRKP